MGRIKRFFFILVKIISVFVGLAASLILAYFVIFYVGEPKIAYQSANKDGFLSSKDWRAVLSPVTIEPKVIPELNPTEQQSIALGKVNYYRSLVKLDPVTLNKHLNKTSQSHAKYNIIHNLSGHTEKHGQSGYSGTWPWDRMKYFGYGLFTYATEVCSARWASESYPLRIDPEWAVDSWVDTVYHRLPVISPNVYEAGFGSGKIGNHVAYVMDFANPGFTPKRQVIYYPVNGQHSVPTEFTGDETPDPLPGKSYPVGYPITVTFNGYDDIRVKDVGLTDDNYNEVDFYKILPNSDKHIGETFAIIPVIPLRSDTTYHVSVLARADGKTINLNWEFRTK